MPHIALPTFFIAAIFLLAPAPVAQDVPPAEAFADGLAAVEKLVGKQKWSQARKQLRTLVAEHAERPYVFLHRPTILDLLETCEYWSTHEPPDPEELVSGRLIRYSPSGGNIKIAYRPGSMEDFLVHDDRKGFIPLRHSPRAGEPIMHGARFAGPHTIRINDLVYPNRKTGLPVLVPCLQPYQQAFRCECTFGAPQKDMGNNYYPVVPATLNLHGEEGLDALDYLEDTPARPGEICDLRLQVTQGGFAAYYDGKKCLTGRKPRDMFGHFAFRNLVYFKEIVVEGKLERSWMQGRIDAAVQKSWSFWRTIYDPEDEVPDWLAVTPNPWEEQFSATAYPGAERAGQAGILAGIQDSLRSGMTIRKRKEIEKLPAEKVTEAFRSWALALLYERARRHDKALEHCQVVREAEPDFLPAEALRLRLTRALEGRDAEIAALRARIDADPTDPWSYQHLAQMLLKMGEWTRAAAVIEEAVTASSYTLALDGVNRRLSKARSGPRWGERYEYKTDHYHVFSDIDRGTCIEAARLLETVARHYAQQLGDVKRSRSRFRVYLFAGEGSYQRYVEDLLDFEPEGTAGVYVLAIDQLLIWNTPEREEMLRTVRHEGLHQYLDSLLEDPPIWLNEGLAVYWEGADLVGLEKFPPQLGNLHLLQEAKGGGLSLSQLLYAGHRQFMAQAPLTYAQAWSFVHFLLHTTPENRSLFTDLLEHLRAGKSHREAVDAVFSDVDLKAVEKELEAYVQQMK